MESCLRRLALTTKDQAKVSRSLYWMFEKGQIIIANVDVGKRSCS